MSHIASQHPAPEHFILHVSDTHFVGDGDLLHERIDVFLLEDKSSCSSAAAAAILVAAPDHGRDTRCRWASVCETSNEYQRMIEQVPQRVGTRAPQFAFDSLALRRAQQSLQLYRRVEYQVYVAVRWALQQLIPAPSNKSVVNTPNTGAN